MPREQNYANHRRWNPLYHFVASPIFAINILVATWLLWKSPSWLTGWALAMAIALYAGIAGNRIGTLMVQGRIIRLEQLLRMSAVLPADLKPRIHELRPRQLVGLRFASDEELPALVRRCLAGELRTADQIKREVRDWQPDHLRA